METQIAQLTKEFSEVLLEDGKARMDSVYTPEELSAIEKETKDLIVKGQQILAFIKNERDALKENET